MGLEEGQGEQLHSQVNNGIGTDLDMNEGAAPIKLEENMIDHELGLAALDDSSKPLEGEQHQMELKVEFGNSN